MKKTGFDIFEKREKIYYFLLFFTFLLIVTSQIFMRMDGMMGYFSAIETFEGSYITDDEMFNKSEIILEVTGEIPQSIPEIYSNGERVGFLDAERKGVTVETDTVIEIFCADDPGGVSVSVNYDDKKVAEYTKQHSVKLHMGYNVIARFSFLK